MATTYTLISSNVLTGSAASVTFSSIPSTYTDLVLRVSARSTAADYRSQMRSTFNGSSATNYSDTILYAFFGAASAGSIRSSGATFAAGDYTVGSTATTNTFSNGEIYIPSYLISQNKPISVSIATENNNATDIAMAATANLWRDTTAISSMTLVLDSGSFDTNSSFSLYGIKSSQETTMTTPTRVEVCCDSACPNHNKAQIIPLTAEEIAANEAAAIEAQAQTEAAEQAALDLAALKASAKAKLIAGTPLTAAEADTLVI